MVAKNSTGLGKRKFMATKPPVLLDNMVDAPPAGPVRLLSPVSKPKFVVDQGPRANIYVLYHLVFFSFTSTSFSVVSLWKVDKGQLGKLEAEVHSFTSGLYFKLFLQGREAQVRRRLPSPSESGKTF